MESYMTGLNTNTSTWLLEILTPSILSWTIKKVIFPLKSRIDENSAKETKQSIFLVEENDEDDDNDDNDDDIPRKRARQISACSCSPPRDTDTYNATTTKVFRKNCHKAEKIEVKYFKLITLYSSKTIYCFFVGRGRKQSNNHLRQHERICKYSRQRYQNGGNKWMLRIWFRPKNAITRHRTNE